MIKEQLSTLLERDYLLTDLRLNINKLLEFPEEQIYSLLENGVKISRNIILTYFKGVGFRCWNDNSTIIGHLPITGVIERKLNTELTKHNQINS